MNSHEKKSASPAENREYQVLKAVNEALSNLLSTSNQEEALERSFKAVCEAIGCDGVYLFDDHQLEENKIIAKSCFGIRYEKDEWKILNPALFEFPLETDLLKSRVNSMLKEDATTIALCKDCPPELNNLLKNLDIESYLTFRIVIDNNIWGGISFFSRQASTEWAQGLRQLLEPFVSSVGNFLTRKRTEERYRNFINHSFDGIYYLHFEKPIPLHISPEEQVNYYYRYGYIQECNMSFARMYGAEEPAQIAGLRVFDVHNGDFFEYNKQSTYEFVKHNYRLINSETVEQDLHGNPVYILNHAIGDIKDGHLLGVWGTQQDITERRKAEMALQENESILKGIVNALPDLKFRINNEYVILDYYESENENESPLVPSSMFLGQKMTRLLPVSVTKPANHAIDMTLKYKKIQTFEYFLPINGEIHYYEGRVSPMNEKEVIMAVRNISDRKRVQIELKEKLRELDEKNKQLTDYIESNFQLENFAYIASHDLREPVRTIHSFAQLLQKNYLALLDEKGKNYINFIIQGAENMNRLIEDLLTYSRVSSEEAVFEQIDPTQLIQITLRNLTSFIEEKQARVQIKALPPVLNANRTKLKQLFQNLITNSIKFHREGQPPKIEISGIDHGEHWLFEIKDNGIGIPVHMHEKIFQLFKKFHYNQEHSGTGIGLALCKRIIEQHGGEIWVESNEAGGSSFYFTIKKQLGR